MELRCIWVTICVQLNFFTLLKWCAGTLQNFETRLLFSSAQVEYIRAWLFATKLTKTLIPLPYSDCLLLESNLRNVSPIYFSNGGELRNSLKVCSDDG